VCAENSVRIDLMAESLNVGHDRRADTSFPKLGCLALQVHNGARATAQLRAVLYLRVSTMDQTTANQERELREIAGRMGCEIVKVYKDHGPSPSGYGQRRSPGPQNSWGPRGP
jgi:hypothetical protein